MNKSIISAESLNNEILNNSGCIIFDLRFNLIKKDEGYNKYLKEHIPGAFYVNLEDDLSDITLDEGGRHPLPNISEYTNLLNKHGINKDSKVIIYDDKHNAMSGRFWWMLRNVGVKNTLLLEGGFENWKKNNFKIESGECKPSFKGNNSFTYDRNQICDIEELKSLISNKDIILIDAREPDRFKGISEPIDKKAGHIPSAVNYFFLNHQDPDGLYLTNNKIKEKVTNTLGDLDKTIVHMCGSGVTACSNFMIFTEILPHHEQKLFVGSWSNWIEDDSNKVIKNND